MSSIDRPQFERQRYWSGQTLRSSDFNDQLAVEDQFRWWHNRALHTAYGVVTGLEVHDRSNDRLDVSAGLAYDCFGRELLLQGAKSISVPANVSEAYSLLIRYRSETPASDRLQSRALEEAELFWKRTRHVSIRDGVQLGQIDADGSVASSAIFQRPVSRAQARPLIGNGSTIIGKTNWQLWQYPDLDIDGDGTRDFAINGVEVTIDTSATGFTDIPCYFASLQGGLLSRPTLAALPGISSTVFGGRARVNSERLVFDRITVSKPDHFVFSLVNLTQAELLEFARRKLYVCWLGIQMQTHASNEVNRVKT